MTGIQVQRLRRKGHRLTEYKKKRGKMDRKKNKEKRMKDKTRNKDKDNKKQDTSEVR